MKYVKGDIIPEHAVAPALLAQYVRYKKVIPVEHASEPIIVSTEPIPPIKLSISVMAHPSRSQFFDYLKTRLGADVPFSIDQKNCLLENSKASWRLYDPKADFHVVVQDDCVVCDNFKERVIEFITEREAERIQQRKPPQGYNFFLKQATNEPIRYENGFYSDNCTRAGLAICLPVSLIEPMLVEFDKQHSRHDDDRISMFMRKHGYRVVFPVPSFIDHRIELESLAKNVVGNAAYKFIDNCEPTIPKIIHQLWVGPRPAPTKWMDSWKRYNPGWEYRLWDEKAIHKEKWINQKHVDNYMKKGIWPGVSDVCTYEILYNHGGFMPGADSVCQRPIDDLFYEEYDSYGCYEHETLRPGYISPLMASVKGSKFAAELIGGLFALSELNDKPWTCTGNVYMGEMFKKTKQKVKIYPSHYMNPVHHTGVAYKGNGKIYAHQMWGSTNGDYTMGA